MPILSYANLKGAVRHPHQIWGSYKASAIPAGLHAESDWVSAGIPAAGTTPSSAVAPTSATTGAITINAPSASTHLWGFVKRARMCNAGNGTVFPGGFWVVDRLSHMGGLSGTVTTAQTVNTAALTRFTSGVGVIMAYEIYTALGTTATTITASYTNQAGTASQTSQAVPIGGANNDNVRILQPFNLASGDTGVKSVQSVTVLATTGTAGNFGVTLFSVLGMYPYNSGLANTHRFDGIEYGTPIFPVQPNACLQVLTYGSGLINGDPTVELGFIEIPD